MTPDRKYYLNSNLLVLEAVADAIKKILMEEQAELDRYGPEEFNDEIDELDGNVYTLQDAQDCILEAMGLIKPMCEG